MVREVPLWLKVAAGIFLAGMTLLLLGPLVVVLGVSVSESQFIAFPPQGLSLKWYAQVFGDARYLVSFRQSLVLALIFGFSLPSLPMVPWLVIIALTGLSAHYSLTSALGLAPATLVAPMEFARLPIIALVGMSLYGESLDPMVFLGAAIIFSANFVNLRLNTRRSARV